MTTITSAHSVPDEGGFLLIDQLLRGRGAFLDGIAAQEDLRDTARALLLTIFAGSAVFGATLGFYRGGIQILFASLKLPLVVLFTAALCTPALTALRVVVGGRARFQKDLALVLGSLALGCMVIAALAPLLLLAMSMRASYHQIIILTVGCCAVGGALGLALLIKGIWCTLDVDRGVVTLTLLLVCALVGTQLSWTLRPYLVRPRTPDVPLVRMQEGSFMDSVLTAFDSAGGNYARDAAPLPGEQP